MKQRLAAVFLVVLGLSFTAQARAASTIVLPRAGQVGLGLQVQGNSFLKSGTLGKEFGAGPGLAVRLRYRMRFERGIGLSFDTQRLKARDAAGYARNTSSAFDTLQDAPAVLRDRLTLTTAGIEVYQFFDTRSRTTKMISAGAGLAQVSAHLSDGEMQFPLGGDGVFVSLGAGLERFFYRSLAWDLSTHYMAVLHDGSLTHDVQIHTGIMFYAAY